MTNYEVNMTNILFSKVASFLIIMIILTSTCSIWFSITISNIITFLSYSLCSLIVVLYIFRFKCSNISLLIVLFLMCMLISTLLGENASLNYFFKIFYKILAMTFYLDWGIEKNKDSIINGLNISLFILIVVNYISIVMYPYGIIRNQGLTNIWFLGYDNVHSFYFFPALFISIIAIENKKRTLNYIICIIDFIVISLCIIYCFSANTVVAYFIFILYVIFYHFLKNISSFNIRNYILIYYVLFFLIVVFRFQNIFSWLIIDVLHKNLSFTGRTYIWDKMIDYIKLRPFLGYGFETPQFIALKMHNITHTHAHNTIYDILYKGGILSLSIFLIILKIISQKLLLYDKYKITKYLSFGLFCLLILMNFEAREDKIGLYIILVLSYKINYIVGEDINESN